MTRLLSTNKERSSNGSSGRLSSSPCAILLLASVGMFAIMNVVKMSPNLVTDLRQTAIQQVPMLDTANNVVSDKVKGSELIPLDVLTGGNDPFECPAPLVPIYNQIIPPMSIINANNETDGVPSRRRIPRIIHMSMKSRCAPRDLAETFEIWKKQFPYHQIYFHDDNAVEALFERYDWHEFPHLTKFMQCVKFKGAMTIDVWRLLIVYKYGGLYTDVDNRPTESFNETAPIQEDDDAFFMSDAWNRPSQWFFAMIPGHPIVYFAIYQIMANLQNLENIASPKIVFVTGPGALKNGYEQYIMAGDSAVDKQDRHFMLTEGLHIGYQGKNTRKTRQPIYINGGNLGDVVEYNGRNMTKKDRMYAENNLTHWQQEDKSWVPQVSCMQHLYQSDHGDTTSQQ